MTTAFVNRGESLDYVNTGSGAIAAGDIVSLTSRIGVAGSDIPAGETGAVEVIGLFDMPATATGAVAVGTALYFDGVGVTDTKGESTVSAGYCAKAFAAGDATIRVKLLG